MKDDQFGSIKLLKLKYRMGDQIIDDLAVAQCITGNQGNEIKTRAPRYEIFFCLH